MREPGYTLLGGKLCQGGFLGRKHSRAYLSVVLLSATLFLGMPSAAQAAPAAPAPSRGDIITGFDESMKMIKQAYSIFHTPEGNDPERPSHSAVAAAIASDKNGSQVGVQDVFVVNRMPSEGGGEDVTVWAVSFLSKKKYMAVDMVFDTFVYTNAPGRPPGEVVSSGVLMVDPVWMSQLMLGAAAGAGKTPEDIANAIDARPLPGWPAAGAGLAGAMTVAILTGLAGLGGGWTPKMPGVQDYNKSGWIWMRDPANGRWYMSQGSGHPIPVSIYGVDPTVMGNNVAIYNHPTCDMTSAADTAEASFDKSMPAGFAEKLKPENWRKLSLADRQAAVRQMSDVIADAAGVRRGSYRVVFDPNLDGCAEWSGRNRTVTINPNTKEMRSPYGSVQALAHEIRHAAQEDYNNPLSGAPKDYRDLMTFNDKGYKGAGKDFTRYSGQLIERDAENFGRAVAGRLFGKAMGTN